MYEILRLKEVNNLFLALHDERSRFGKFILPGMTILIME